MERETGQSPRPREPRGERIISISSQGPSLVRSLQEIWEYRELLYFLTWRDVKVRYRQTALGVAWAVLQPLLAMLLFALFFGKLAHMPSDGMPYALFAYAGLLPWMFFANAITNSGESMVANPDLITKVYLPRVLVPCGAVLAAMLDFGIGFMLLIALMLYYGVAPTAALAAFPGLVMLTVLLASAVGMWMAALNVKYRDVRYALPFAIQLWMFASPVIYPSSLVPPQWRWLLLLNPLTGLIDGFRSCLFGRSFDWPGLGMAAGLTVGALFYALWSFRKMETDFADVI